MAASTSDAAVCVSAGEAEAAGSRGTSRGEGADSSYYG